MTKARIVVYSVSLVSLALIASASLTLTIVALDAQPQMTVASKVQKAPSLPKPTPHCQECRDATVADVKE